MQLFKVFNFNIFKKLQSLKYLQMNNMRLKVQKGYFKLWINGSLSSRLKKRLILKI